MTNKPFIGKNLIELEAVDSTNSYIKVLLTSDPPAHGTVVVAREQFGGRGQMGTTWSSESNQNITMSVLLYPDFLEADKQFFLSMAVALAVKDFCEFILKDDIKIKWPNDIYYLNQKLGGILIENTISGNKLSSSIIGIGLNINQSTFDPDIPNPASFAQIAGHTFDLPSLVTDLCSFLEKYYLQLQQLHFNFLDRAYTDSLYRYQQTHEFKKGDRVFKGEINGVTKEGKLILHSNGKEQRFAFKEVQYVI
ncbi:MAG: biotin--[acetyl-CoA-carboxylase] ligase [Bacteroidetes bacterium]|nr:biotin--[acetyl-CoA-carboxylase] ligase [Bacteroidota bacterium]